MMKLTSEASAWLLLGACSSSTGILLSQTRTDGHRSGLQARGYNPGSYDRPPCHAVIKDSKLDILFSQRAGLFRLSIYRWKHRQTGLAGQNFTLLCEIHCRQPTILTAIAQVVCLSSKHIAELVSHLWISLYCASTTDSLTVTIINNLYIYMIVQITMHFTILYFLALLFVPVFAAPIYPTSPQLFDDFKAGTIIHAEPGVSCLPSAAPKIKMIIIICNAPAGKKSTCCRPSFSQWLG